VRPALDDQQLVAAMQEGQAAVASMLCDRVWPQIDRTVRRLLGHADPDRDDLGQLALIELVNTIGRYRGDCSLDTWTQTVTSHLIFKHIRRRRLERQIFSDLLAEDVPRSAPVVQGEHQSLSRDLLGRIAVLLDGMDHQRAWAFVLHDVMGYDLREISLMTKSTVAAAQSRLVRGRRELHTRIAADAALVDMVEGEEA
jgi:RNA polymerase sigma-70 factor (ECF subfamily)